MSAGMKGLMWFKLEAFVTQHFHRIFVFVYCKVPLKVYSNQRINRLTEYLPSDPFKSSFQLEGKCTLCRCKSGRITPLSAWINIGNGKGSPSWVWPQSENRQARLPCAHDLLNPKSTGRLSRTSTVPSFESFQSEAFFLLC